jgi:RNA polymerase sigma-70 factor (ECF subfamily)
LVRVFNEVRTELVSALYYLLNNFEDAQDAAQETFLKCWRARDAIPRLRNPRAWIFHIGMNAARDLRRNAWRRRVRPMTHTAELIPCSQASPVEILEEQERQSRLHDAVLDLRPEVREVFLLRQNGCLTYEEIARIQSAPVGTIKTRMRAAVTRLREVFQAGLAMD